MLAEERKLTEQDRAAGVLSNKHVLGCRHLISRDKQGIEIFAYCAILACLLLALVTGHKPTKVPPQHGGWYMIGRADEEELLTHLEKLKPRQA